MNRQRLVLWLVAVLASATLWAAEADLGEARRRLMKGDYAEAARLYRQTAGENPAAALGLARCLTAEGKTDEAVRVLTPLAGRSAPVRAELARLALERGDYAAAGKHVEAALKLDTEQPLARWVRGELMRTSGRLDEAQAEYRWFVRYYTSHDVKDPETLRWIGLAAGRYARWNRLHDQFDFLVNELYPDALELDPLFWPAHYESGLLFLEKYNRPEARQDLEAALAINPNAAEVHAAMACLALIDRDIPGAQASAERALKINPRLLDAWLVKADLAWENFQTEEALKLLQEKALPLCPVSEETLGRIAACYVLLDGLPEDAKGGRFSELVAKVTKRNEHAGEFFYTLGYWLEDRTKFAQAERYFREAIKRMPQMVGPRTQLGLVMMCGGREDEASRVLDEAFDVDPFNVRVHNMLEVLDVLEEYETLESEHFAIRFDPRRDRLLARHAARFLEATYPELCERFGYRPKGKQLFEIFTANGGIDGHGWFSARMTGLPYVGTVAACAGRMVAMVSPNEPGLPQRFNWAVTARHELVHLITLEQTDFNIPHWFTEALAVSSEGYRRPAEWNELLARRAAAKDLFDLETINFGFVRPHTSDDWQLAYCQAELYAEYMLQRFGDQAWRKLLAAYADNLVTPAAIRRAFGVSQEDFERGYVEYVEKLIADLSPLESPVKEPLEELQQRHSEHPEDVATAARLAQRLLVAGRDDEAKRLAEEVLGKDPKQQAAAYVAARLEVRGGKLDEAVALLEKSLDRKSPHPEALNLLASLYVKQKKYEEATDLYLLAEKLEPANARWTKSLARVCLLAGDRDRLPAVLARVAAAEPADVLVRKKLAQLALESKDYAAAADWANRALEIDVLDADIHRMLGEALLGRGDPQAAIEPWAAAAELKPGDADLRVGLARSYAEAGQPQKARDVLKQVLQTHPQHPAAGQLLKQLDEGDPP